MYMCYTISSFLLIFRHRFVSNYENFDTKLLINHAYRAREREKKIQKQIIYSKRERLPKIKITSQQFHSRKSRIHIDTAVKI